MATTRQRGTEWPVQDLLVSSVRHGQQAAVDAVGAWAKAVETLMPLKPSDWLNWYLGLSRRLMEARSEFAQNAIAAARPVLVPAGERNGQAQNVTGLRLETLTVKDLDRIAEANNLQTYPHEAPKAEKIAALEAVVSSNAA